PVGFSDHTTSTIIPALAVSMGSNIIEKHFTLEKDLDTPDHSFALNPNELSEMVKNIRLAENIKGSKIKKPTSSEIETSRINARRSIYTKQKVKRGEKITEDKIKFIRPAIGLSPKYVNKIIGSCANKDLETNKAIKISDINWS
ncbi:MAG: N-acetylneuraminate synthase family protein, partial [bacterium]